MFFLCFFEGGGGVDGVDGFRVWGLRLKGLGFGFKA